MVLNQSKQPITTTLSSFEVLFPYVSWLIKFQVQHLIMFNYSFFSSIVDTEKLCFKKYFQTFQNLLYQPVDYELTS